MREIRTQCREEASQSRGHRYRRRQNRQSRQGRIHHCLSPQPRCSRQPNAMALAGIKLKVHVTHSTIVDAMADATQKSVLRERDWAVKTETFEVHHEATKALALAVARLMAIMVISNLVLLILF
jgi:hypothetical protein